MAYLLTKCKHVYYHIYMATFNSLATSVLFDDMNFFLDHYVQTGHDGKRRGGRKPDATTATNYIMMLDQANEYALEWMEKQENRSYLQQLRVDYIHKKGWSTDKRFKAEYHIPSNVFLALPRELQERDGFKRLNAWIKLYHPYFKLSWWG